MTGEDLIFTGAKLHLKTGMSIHADQTQFLSMQKLKDGFYNVHLDATEAETSRRDREVFKGKRPALSNNLLRITPAPPARVSKIWTSYIHDHRYTGLVSGIEVQPHFFKFIKAYADNRGGKSVLRLRVDKGNKAPWMKTAKHEIGVAETPGANHTARVLQYSREAGYPMTTDDADSPWCGAYVGWVMKKHGYQPPAILVRAKEWKNFGRAINAPTYGAIGVKSRSGGGHVAFVIGKNRKGDKLFMLGGNQNNSVNIAEYDKSVFEAFVLPSAYDSRKDWLPVYDKNAAGSGSEA